MPNGGRSSDNGSSENMNIDSHAGANDSNMYEITPNTQPNNINIYNQYVKQGQSAKMNVPGSNVAQYQQEYN